MPLYFHVRGETNLVIDQEKKEIVDVEVSPTITFCVDKVNDETLNVGYAVVHGNDQFNKKIGRNIANGRMNFIPYLKASDNTRIHVDVERQLPAIIHRAAWILKMQGEIKAFISSNVKNSKARSYTEIKQHIPTDTEVSNMIMHDDV